MIRSLTTSARSFILTFMIVGSAAAATTPSATINLATQDQQRLEKDIARLKPLLDEYHQGKRDDQDGGAILFRLMHDYGLLGLAKTEDGKALVKEWQQLVKKHPEFRRHPPMHLHEEMAAKKERLERQHEIDQRAAAFTPKDSASFGIVGYDHQVAIPYQYHLDFFELPESIIVKNTPHDVPGFAKQLYDTERGQFITAGDLVNMGAKPFKTMTFRHKITVVSLESQARHFLFACDDLVNTYSPSDSEEREELRRKYPAGLDWANKTGEHGHFCGAIGLDGKIIYEFPFNQDPPSTVFNLYSTPDGYAAIISVGEKVSIDEDDEVVNYFRNTREAILFTYPDKIERFAVKDAAKVNGILESHGFHGRPWPWY